MLKKFAGGSKAAEGSMFASAISDEGLRMEHPRHPVRPRLAGRRLWQGGGGK